ncbi:MAG TPA: Lrp/AsnC family transcriptional regulator [Methanomassiliicoccales archaeon]
MVTVDQMNRKIIGLLLADGRMTYNDVSVKLRRSSSTVRDRIRRLEDDKVILGYYAIVNAERMGMNADAIVLANLNHETSAADLKKLAKIEGVREVLQISGQKRILVRVSASDNHSLEDIVTRELIPMGLKDIELKVVLDSVSRPPGL